VIFLKKFLALILVVIFMFSGCEKSTKENAVTPQSSNENIIGVWINYNEIQNFTNDCDKELQLLNFLLISAILFLIILI
jgi:hypothetical protein